MKNEDGGLERHSRTPLAGNIYLLFTVFCGYIVIYFITLFMDATSVGYYPPTNTVLPPFPYIRYRGLNVFWTSKGTGA